MIDPSSRDWPTSLYQDMLTGVLDELDTHIAVLSKDGKTIWTNRAWNNFARANGLDPQKTIGLNYIELCESATGLGSDGAQEVGRALRQIADGFREEFEQEYPCHSISKARWFRLRVRRFESQGDVFIVVFHEDVTTRKEAHELLQLSEAKSRRFAQIISQSADAIIVTDENLLITYANPAFQISHSVKEADLIGKSLETLHEEMSRKSVEELRGTLLKGEQWSGVVRTHRDDGTVCEEETTIFPIKNMDDRIVSYACFRRDIGKHLELERTLRERDEWQSLILRGTNDGLWDWRIEEGLIICSPRLLEILGLDSHHSIRQMANLRRLVHQDDLHDFLRKIQKYFRSRTGDFQYELRIKCQSNQYCWFLCRGRAIWDENGNPVRMAGSVSDITGRKIIEERLSYSAMHDPLTGLPNRTLFMDRLKHSLSYARRHDDYLFAMLYLDIDRFKVINDSLGHFIGDELLKIVAGRLRANIRENDTVARMGGDEFTVLLDGIKSEREALQVTERILADFSQPVELNNVEIVSGSSVGIAFGRGSYVKAEEVIRDADTALHRAKETGRGRYAIFDQNMHSSVLRTLEIENGLRYAIPKGQLRLVFQPIVSLPGKQISGLECLTRWDHPEKGPIPPNEFIQIAEEGGLIHDLGEWVFRTAANQVAEWKRMFPHWGDFLFTVNVSARQFASRTLADQLRRNAQAAGIRPCDLAIEITETAMIDHPEMVRVTLDELQKMGVRVLLDDFGTGYSSLSHLMDYPVDFIKVDRAFVGTMEEKPQSRHILRSVSGLADSLEINVIAEGVETAAHLSLAEEFGCAYAQGYLFSRPLEKDAAEDLLEMRTKN